MKIEAINGARISIVCGGTKINPRPSRYEVVGILEMIGAMSQEESGDALENFDLNSLAVWCGCDGDVMDAVVDCAVSAGLVEYLSKEDMDHIRATDLLLETLNLAKPSGKEKPAQTKRQQRRSRRTLNDLVIPSLLDTPEFREAWATWVKYRKEHKSGLNVMTADKQLQFMVRLGAKNAVKAINLSIQNGWVGLFDPTKDGLKKDDKQDQDIGKMSDDQQQAVLGLGLGMGHDGEE